MRAALLAQAKLSTLDGGELPLVAVRDERWYCLLCERQFRSERHLARHLTQSKLHREAARKASASGRLALAAGGGADDDAPDLGAKRARSEGGGGGGGGGEASAPGGGVGGGDGTMSALEQMALFEKRLQSQAAHKPEKKATNPAHIDSNKARSINQQMDWECDKCGAFNFARSVVCYQCKAHVNADTKYLGNKLNVLKQERFARVFGGVGEKRANDGRAAFST